MFFLSISTIAYQF